MKEMKKMMWNDFAEVNERFIEMTPTQMVKYFDDNPSKYLSANRKN